ncbi:3-oxoacyl-[acyl-carrier-protein] reductase FabG [Thalassoglobus neptunius]|uniref:3-oxoacyl-[acyl-carrier-protein] reductase FabG n=1 Tax=Thalassoglobus neptunius TaxID=1938619 RepID=A0A5C5X416_9PLAN|nr:SDR family oxidoreductase [Thalassoglobus neptunius]TWT57061.1 3-oxoacyl-[acyl-carrier-protein] reductase FabG [Thalassoglobus neptunius]
MILSGRNAIVTGGAVRIGREIGRSLAKSGVNVCVHYGTSEDEAQAAVDEFTSLGVQSMKVSADLGHPVDASRAIFSAARSALGEITLLVNCAAIFEPGSLASTTLHAWERHSSINLMAPFFLTQELVNNLKNETAAVVNLIDWRGTTPVAGHCAYTMSKAGLAAQTKILAQELGPSVRVNGVAPGAILPAPGESQSEFEAKAKLNPLNQTGGPEMIAEAVVFLLGSDFITGEILHVTGGQQLTVSN